MLILVKSFLNIVKSETAVGKFFVNTEYKFCWYTQAKVYSTAGYSKHFDFISNFCLATDKLRGAVYSV